MKRSENYDLYKQRIEQYTQQLAEDQRRQRKIVEVRNAYMTPKEKQQMKMERMGAIDKARKAAEEERRNAYCAARDRVRKSKSR